MTSLASIQKSLSEHNPTSTISAECKAALSYYVHADPQLSDGEFIEELQQKLPVELLYCDKLLRGPTAIYRIVGGYLVVKGFNYEMAPGSNWLTRGLAKCFFNDKEDKQYAFRCLDNLRNSGHQPDAANPAAPQAAVILENNDLFDKNKAAHDILQRFKKESLFTGKLGENISQFLASYEEASADYGLNGAQNFSIFTTCSTAKPSNSTELMSRISAIDFTSQQLEWLINITI